MSAQLRLAVARLAGALVLPLPLPLLDTLRLVGLGSRSMRSMHAWLIHALRPRGPHLASTPLSVEASRVIEVPVLLGLRVDFALVFVVGIAATYQKRSGVTVLSRNLARSYQSVLSASPARCSYHMVFSAVTARSSIDGALTSDGSLTLVGALNEYGSLVDCGGSQLAWLQLGLENR